VLRGAGSAKGGIVGVTSQYGSAIVSGHYLLISDCAMAKATHPIRLPG
jgi:hypothetical protein